MSVAPLASPRSQVPQLADEPVDPKQQTTMEQEMARSVRRLDGSLALAPMPTRDTSTVNYHYRTSPRDHPAFAGAAGVMSDSVLNRARHSKEQRWVGQRTPHREIQKLFPGP